MTIVLTPSENQEEPSLNYRRGWSHRWDSTYARLAKLGYANAFDSRDIARLVISRRCGRKTRIVERPSVDLRSTEYFDLDALVQLTGESEQAIALGFVVPTLQADLYGTSKHLRYCRKCMDSLLHVSLFQMHEFETCPIHQAALESHCPHCGGLILYQLAPDIFRNPFCCPHCECFLGADLSWQYRLKSISVPGADSILGNIFDVVLNRAETLSTWARGDQEFRCQGVPTVFASRIGADQGHVRSLGFAERVLKIVSAYNHPEQRERSGISANWQVAIPTNRRNRRGIEPAVDDEVRRLETVYRALRRHIWRRDMRMHQPCFLALARHLWWDIDGEPVPDICAHAEALLRWRMHWETVAIPQRLAEKPSHRPYRIAAWLLGDAPFLPANWSRAGARWVNEHVFGTVCVGHFRDLLERAVVCRRLARSRIWRLQDSCVNPRELWVAYGRDRHHDPLQLFFDLPDRPTIENMTERLQQHRLVHLAGVAGMVR